MRTRYNLGCLVALALLVAAAVGGGAFLLTRHFGRSASLEPFEAHLSQYTSITGLREVSPEGEAYITGKIITVNIGEDKIDPIYFELPGELVASTPQEVGTVIWLEYGKKIVGYYSSTEYGDAKATPDWKEHNAAYRRWCKVSIIDRERAAIVDVKTFWGSKPPSSRRGTGPRSGSEPVESIVDYLRTLPVRPSD